MNDGEEPGEVDASAASGATPRRDDDDALAPRAERDPLDDESGDPPGDERAHDDPFGPPKIPCECYCLHCRRTFMSDGIWFQRIKNAQPGKLDGFWMCPTPNCDGKGFTFDIFPTDPDHPANEGWYDGEGDDEAEDQEWDEALDAAAAASVAEEADAEYDPDEAKWKQLDEELEAEDDDDIEGEEWKFGIQPGDPLPESEWVRSSRRDWEEEQQRYDAPDERPREIEWEYGEGFNEDDIPF